MAVNCSSDECPVLLDSQCVFYEGANLAATGIVTNDNLQTVIEKLNDIIADGGAGNAVWGGITGTVTDQTDLITYLSSTYLTAGAAAGIYVPLGRNITINGVTQN